MRPAAPKRRRVGAGGAGDAAPAGQEALPSLEELQSQGMIIERRASPLDGDPMGSCSAAGSDVTVFAIVTADGRICGLCEVKDTAADPVENGRTIVWAYICKKTLTNKGYVCYYCQRVFNARFKAKYKSVAALKIAFGQDLNVIQNFKHWRGICIKIFVDAGCREVTVRWGDEASASQLFRRTAQQAALEDFWHARRGLSTGFISVVDWLPVRIWGKRGSFWRAIHRKTQNTSPVADQYSCMCWANGPRPGSGVEILFGFLGREPCRQRPV